MEAHYLERQEMSKGKWVSEIPKIKELGSMGMNMTTIATKYGITRQRMKQIVQKYIPDWQENYGQAVNRKERQDARYAKWGVREDSELYQAKRRKFLGKKYNALRTGRIWELDFGDVEWPTHCPILGIELDYFADGKAQENSVSFDQDAPDLGYIKDNVTVVSWRANRIKNNGSADEHRLIAEYLDKKV